MTVVLELEGWDKSTSIAQAGESQRVPLTAALANIDSPLED